MQSLRTMHYGTNNALRNKQCYAWHTYYAYVCVTNYKPCHAYYIVFRDICICIWICVYIHIYIYTHTHTHTWYEYIHIHMYMYVSESVCLVWIYIHIHVYMYVSESVFVTVQANTRSYPTKSWLKRFRGAGMLCRTVYVCICMYARQHRQTFVGTHVYAYAYV